MPDQLFFDIVKMVVALTVIVGLVYLMVYLLRRFMPGAARASAERIDLYMISQLAVGSRQKIAVVRVHDRTLVVGIGEEGINLLTELTPSRQKAAEKAQEKDADDPRIFADMLSWRKDAEEPEEPVGARRRA